MEARHNKSTTTAANLASCLTALTRAAAAHDGGETILAIRDLSRWGIANASLHDKVKEDAAAVTTVAATDTMAVAKVESPVDKRAAADYSVGYYWHIDAATGRKTAVIVNWAKGINDRRYHGMAKQYTQWLNVAAGKKAEEDARKAEIKDAKDAAAAEAAVNVVKHGLNLSDAELEVHDDGLLYYIQKTVRPLQLSCYDLKSICRRFGLYAEYFPPGANGRHRFLVDTETWRTYCELQFSQFPDFPLYLVEDENETACS